jgi:hypothetical protein
MCLDASVRLTMTFETRIAFSSIFASNWVPEEKCVVYTSEALQPASDLILCAILHWQRGQEHLLVIFVSREIWPLGHCQFVHEDRSSYVALRCLRGPTMTARRSSEKLASDCALLDQVAITDLRLMQLLHSLLHIIRYFQFNSGGSSSASPHETHSAHTAEESKDQLNLLLRPTGWEAAHKNTG